MIQVSIISHQITTKESHMLLSFLKTIVLGIICLVLTGFTTIEQLKEKYPKSELTINSWVYPDKKGDKENEKAQYRHSWQIWEYLTQPRDQNNLPLFATFRSSHDIACQLKTGKPYIEPVNFSFIKPSKRVSLNRGFGTSPETQNNTSIDTDIAVSVGYNGSAAKHALENKLFLKSSLQSFIDQGYDEIPAFPNDAITIKPVLKIVPKNGDNYSFPVWTEKEQKNGEGSPSGYDQKKWKKKVFVVTDGSGKGRGAVAAIGANATPETTYNLDDFIHHQLSEKEAENYKNANTGDYLILVAMHVTTREIKRWTWQSFWWTAEPSVPVSPTNQSIIDERPKNMTDGRGHYAMTVAYQMITPAQPITGGQNIGKSLYAYNPYLEAGFGHEIFQETRAILSPDFFKVETNNLGVQTNCMSCHRLAMYNPNIDYLHGGTKDKLNIREYPYAASTYIDANDKVFNGSLKLDFAWSIIGSLVDDSLTCDK